MDESKVDVLENSRVDVKDALTEVLRNGARKMPAEAIEEEVEGFLRSLTPALRQHPRGARRAPSPHRERGKYLRFGSLAG